MEIPEDVMQEAHDAYVKARELAKGGPAKVGEVIWHPIARAILAERERAAKIADEYDTGWTRFGPNIAKAIRASR